ncbi:MAG: putative RNA-binding protein Jag [Myxococcota bacterium]|jgi:predicted RNA-binding protein Jag
MSTTQQRISSEGRTLGEAIRNAAELLSITPDRVGHEIDKAHFLSESGRSQGASTVKIFAWSRAPVEPAEPAEPTEPTAADAARDWLSGLIKRMGFEAKIQIRMSGDKRADLGVTSPDGRHLVGRRGATLHAIQELMEASVPAASDGWVFRIDILGGDRDRDNRGGDRDRGGRGGDRDRGGRDDRRSRGRDDRGGGGGRGRDDRGGGRGRDDRGGGRGRDDRGGGRGRDDRGGGRGRDDRGGGSRRRTSEDVDALRRLAEKLGRRVQESGEAIVVRQELNSFERRIIHVTIGDMKGLETQSVLQDDIKRVKIMKAGGSEE